MKKKVYLDHNVIIEAEKNKRIFDYLCSVKKKYVYYYSPAHIEEIFRKAKLMLEPEKTTKSRTTECLFYDENLYELVALFLFLKGYINESNYHVDISHIISLMNCIDLLTGNKDILPACSSKNVINWVITESTLECLGRVASIDTTKIIERRGEELYNDMKKITEERKNDKEVRNISNLNEKDIWDNHYIKEAIERFNCSEIKEYIRLINNSTDYQYKNFPNNEKVSRVDDDFKIKKFIFKERKYSRIEIELTFEILFQLLNANGYRKEKKDKSVSSIHDVSHAIYGLYCDIFVTCDENFYKKLKAVHYYLGIEREVYFCDQKKAYENICEILK